MSYLQALVIGLAFIQLSHAFEPTHRRFLSGHDLQRTLVQVFPNREQTIYSNLNCDELDGRTSQILGAHSPQSGTPVTTKPGPLYLNWWRACVRKSAESQWSHSLNRGGTERHRIIPAAIANPYEVASVRWASIPEPRRLILLNHWVSTLGGPAIHPDPAAAAKKLFTKHQASGNRTTQEIYTAVALEILSSDAFLSY